MGYLQDLAVGSNHITPTKPRVGLDRASGESLLSYGEITGNLDLAADFAAANEVSVIPEQTDAGVGDTYTITVNLTVLGESFTTAGIAYNAVDTVIETAIDVAATALPVTSWTNGDISVSMAGAAGIDDGTVTLTFDGTSVVNTPALVSITPTGFTETGSTSRTTPGQGGREATQALFDMNIVSGTLQGSGDAPSWTKPSLSGRARPGTGVIRDLALSTIDEDGTEDAYDALAALYPEIATP